MRRAMRDSPSFPSCHPEHERMARPVGKQFLRDEPTSLRQRIRPMGMALAKMEIRASRSS
ncbi:protein of unknown function [Rhodovastum atsumiense]|nr:protein of unknown function [Rhodovastum atsumiense]